jgi:hypothetical protein
MAVKTEEGHAGGFLVSEAAGYRSRDIGVVASGQNLKAGAVVAQLTADSKFVEYDDVGSDGSEVAVGVLLESTDGALAADKEMTVIVRDAEVNGGEIVWFAAANGTNIANGTADLAAQGIIVRAAV